MRQRISEVVQTHLRGFTERQRGECGLKVDKVYLLPSPGSGQDLAAKLSPRFVLMAHNSCKGKLEGGTVVEIAFYDREGYRTGVMSQLFALMPPGEKTKTVIDIPEPARALGPVWKVAVLSIKRSPGGAA